MRGLGSDKAIAALVMAVEARFGGDDDERILKRAQQFYDFLENAGQAVQEDIPPVPADNAKERRARAARG